MKKAAKTLSILLTAALAGSMFTAYAEQATPETASGVYVAEMAPAQDEETPELEYVTLPGGREGFEQELKARSKLADQGGVSVAATYAELDTNYAELCERVIKAIAARQEMVDIHDLRITFDQIKAFAGEPGTLAGGYKVKNGIQYSFYKGENTVASLILSYYPEEDCAKMNELVGRIKARVEQGKTDLEKVMLLHNEIVAATQYDMQVYDGGSDSDSPIYTAYGVFMNRVAVCDGYTKAFACIANELGIPTVRLSSEEMNHAWNLVQVDGNWYEVDCTWDDTEGAYMDYGFCSYKYFMRSENDFANKCDHDGTDVIGFYDGFDKNMADAAVDKTYDDAWWVKLTEDNASGIMSLIQLYDGDWYFAHNGVMRWRDNLWDGTDTFNRVEGDCWMYGCSLIGNRVFGAEKERGSNKICECRLDGNAHTLTWVKDYPVQNWGVKAFDDKLYYAATMGKQWGLQELDIGTVSPDPVPDPKPNPEPGNDDSYVVENNTVYGVSEATTPERFLATLGGENGLTVQNLAPNGNVGTGTQVCNAAGDVVMTVVVYGDLNGDAVIDSSDLVLMRRALLGMTMLEGDFAKAATFSSKSGTVPTSQDLTQMRRYQLKVVSKLG